MSDFEAAVARRADAIIRNGRQGATTSAATARDAAYNSVLDRRNMKITPCRAKITMRVGPIEAPEDYPHTYRSIRSLAVKMVQEIPYELR